MPLLTAFIHIALFINCLYMHTSLPNLTHLLGAIIILSDSRNLIMVRGQKSTKDKCLDISETSCNFKDVSFKVLAVILCEMLLKKTDVGQPPSPLIGLRTF